MSFTDSDKVGPSTVINGKDNDHSSPGTAIEGLDTILEITLYASDKKPKWTVQLTDSH